MRYVTVAPRRIGEIDLKGRSLPAINSFRRGSGFRIYRRERGDGATAALIARPIRLNIIPVLMVMGTVYIDIVECFIYYKKGYYSGACLKNRGNFLLKNSQTHR
jgi:hypothetical protein